MRPYFWDVKFEDLHPDKHWYIIVKRLLDRGNTKAIRWTRKTYGDEKIKQVLLQTHDLDVTTATFWADALGISRSSVPCLNKPYSPRHFGLYS